MDLPCACTTTRKANRALFRFYEETMEPSGLTVTQFSILRSLSRNSPRPLSELAEELVMERTSLYRTLKPLENQRSISISQSGKGRVKLANLTAKGMQNMELATPYWEQAQNKVVALIGDERWQEMSQLLLNIPVFIKSLK